MEHREYNGWYNYETWVTALWISNEEPSYLYWREQAQKVLNNAEEYSVFTKTERATLTLADQLKDEHEEEMPKLQGIFSDLLGAAMSEVNWYEIAQHQIEDVR